MTVSARRVDPVRAARAWRRLRASGTAASAATSHARAPMRVPMGRRVAMRWMHDGAQRGMVGTDGPGNRYKDSSRNTHG